ncbi:MAG: hypothetical protein H7X97_11965, partial [Opitutaceae bacterium]|nr:hypothetical protein [Verrucomicrobiales bacterium]
MNHLSACLRCGAGRSSLPVILLLALLISGATVTGQSFSVSIEPSLLEIGEEATLTMQFESLSPQQAPDVSRLTDFSASYTGQSRNTQIINGQATSTISL